MEKTLERLETIEGLSDEYLYILSQSLSSDEAKKFVLSIRDKVLTLY